MTLRTLLVSALLAAAASATLAQEAPTMSFPAPTSENKLWTRWWWMGNAVDKDNLTAQLEAFAKTGLGGVEICPIYGVNGGESREVKFLSPDWMNLLVHTTREAQRLGMNVDLTSGTGWPFGGPMVTKEEASSALNLRVYDSFPKDAELLKPLAQLHSKLGLN